MLVDFKCQSPVKGRPSKGPIISNHSLTMNNWKSYGHLRKVRQDFLKTTIFKELRSQLGERISQFKEVRQGRPRREYNNPALFHRKCRSTHLNTNAHIRRHVHTYRPGCTCPCSGTSISDALCTSFLALYSLRPNSHSCL